MDIRAAEKNSYYTIQYAPERDSNQISLSNRSESRIRDAEVGTVLPQSADQEQDDSVSPAREDDTAPKKDQVSDATIESGLTQEEKLLVEELKKVDTEVRTHEMAHIAAGGQYITSGATFSYQQGPDGKNYAVGGEVSIDTSPEPGDPKETLKKMRQVRAAALAPAHPSSQDLKVASNAASQAAKAMAEIVQIQAQEQAGKMETAMSGYTRQHVSQTYNSVGSMPIPRVSDQGIQNSFYATA